MMDTSEQQALCGPARNMGLATISNKSLRNESGGTNSAKMLRHDVFFYNFNGKSWIKRRLAWTQLSSAFPETAPLHSPGRTTMRGGPKEMRCSRGSSERRKSDNKLIKALALVIAGLPRTLMLSCG